MKIFCAVLILLALGVLTFTACVPSFSCGSSTPAPTPIPTGPVRAEFEASMTNMEGNGWIAFRSLSTGNIKNWYWDFGNGHTSSGPEVQAYYSDNRYYTVTLTVEGWDGTTDTMTKPDYIYVWGCST